MQPGQVQQRQPQGPPIKGTILWSHKLVQGEVSPPPPFDKLPGKWQPANIIPAGDHVLIQWAWIAEPTMVATPSPGGGFVGV